VAGAAARGRRGFIVVRAGLRFRRPGGPVRGPAGPLPERLRQRRRAGDVRGTGPGAALDGPLPDPCPGALPVSPLRHGGPALRRRGSRLAARKDYLPGRSGPPAGPRLGRVPAASLGVVVPPRRLAPRSRLGAVVFHQAFRGGAALSEDGPAAGADRRYGDDRAGFFRPVAGGEAFRLSRLLWRSGLSALGAKELRVPLPRSGRVESPHAEFRYRRLPPLRPCRSARPGAPAHARQIRAGDP